MTSLDLVTLNTTLWYEAFNSGFWTDTKPNFGRVALESKRPPLARKDFSSWPTTLTRHVGCWSVLAALMASNLRWRKQFHRACTEVFAITQLFRCEWNQNELSHHSFPFLDMIKGYDDNQNYVEQTFTSLQTKKSTLLPKQQSTIIWKVVQTNPFLYDQFTSGPYTTNDEMRNSLVYKPTVYYAQTIVKLPWKVISTSQKQCQYLVGLFEQKLLQARK